MKHLIASAALAAVSLACAGCMIEKNKDAKGAEDVKVTTPFGGLKVRANGSDIASDIGLPPYPGASVITNEKNGGSADVDMGFGNFKMRIKVATFATNDSQDQVIAFYKKALGAYGDVITCKDKKPIGKPDHTAEGLDCAGEGTRNDDNIHISDDLSVEAGSKHHQRIVAVESKGADGKRTKIDMVELQLPDVDEKNNN